ncbi:MAG: class I SAM-dependent methyltransferase [Microcoleus sp. PH2017_39_LGB_O_B]|uniref:class I SAM-dependent methyltransferase n=1 Tax=unclassified Microcoleus TaxID=2642155 RepID=UPI001D97032C|nr:MULTISPECIES: class I SAM-dependent methyltransferase [unclassified Microcoleus]TAF84282.1 MAG: class I SAM-dependent methyltransferase [Oscillatoriales cyanobacterium]MCC3451639.1 class I SAM-dependent methyltransferase [Microcoleus sp. PH2017_09_SFU_O_A]MCC3493113.1 class I SAM-dependent methyltransferase [Microcoleus sp. PH2017_16_JOR_D_A]MCC3632543.1 class I SAM-dependent methyltransferase [Microcoleus sp. PH2017_39_LGB_O_B]MCC3644766.1 class I SAM-dependent methyltransferase [Microcole
MDTQELDLINNIRQLFDNAPYPKVPLEQSPKKDYELLYLHNLLTPYYLKNQNIIETQGKIILDAGCGSGYKSLILAEANPGAKIVGVDLSEKSIKLARQRLQYYGFENTEFHVLSIEELPSLGLEFDYINTDEVLYLLPDAVKGLVAMKSVLKPDGIIRTNLHSSTGRNLVHRAQGVFKLMGLMDGSPGDFEIELVREIMTALKDEVMLKNISWNSERGNSQEWILANYLLLGDKGCTVPEMFSTLKSANLELISMVNWQQWELLNLFKNPHDLPAFLGMSLPETSLEDRLHLFTLLHPTHRLLDFWCSHPDQTQSFVPVSEWTPNDWQAARVYLHPQLASPQAREDLLSSIAAQTPFEISRYIPLPTTSPIAIESVMASCLLLLWDGVQPVISLVKRWLQLRPLRPATLEAVTEEKAFEEVKELLERLEACLYVLLERKT